MAAGPGRGPAGQKCKIFIFSETSPKCTKIVEMMLKRILSMFALPNWWGGAFLAPSACTGSQEGVWCGVSYHLLKHADLKSVSRKQVFFAIGRFRVVGEWEWRQKVSDFFLHRSAKESGRTGTISVQNCKNETKKHRFYIDF